MIICQ